MIVNLTTFQDQSTPPSFEDDDEETFSEGREVYRIHRSKERNMLIVKLAKEKWLLSDPMMCCQACNFSFLQTYGELGRHFIEAHHIYPIHKLTEETQVRIEDFAMVCSNCHRMLPKNNDVKSVDELKSLLVSF